MKISTVYDKISTCHHKKFQPVNMKISTYHRENLDLPSWKSWPFTITILTVHNKILTHYHHENLSRSLQNLDLSSWKSQPFIMKLSNCHHENLDLWSWKFWHVIMKISTVHNKISNNHHENLNVPSRKSQLSMIKSRPVIMKISTNDNKISTCHHEDKSQLLTKMRFHRLQLIKEISYKHHYESRHLFRKIESYRFFQFMY